ncbi:MAG: TetR family transcriptional regulator [Chloroflexales bacterium]|nr:TetR family transcriptional regulator [Chloroflexales bacterium]
MSATKGPQRTRAALLAAAFTVIKHDGLNALTLDAVAHTAGVSKGGLLYHFPSREALVTAMISSPIEEFERALVERLRAAGYDRTPGAWLRAYIEANMDVVEHGADQSAALLAAVATRPDMLDPIREHTVAWQRRLEDDGLDPTLATIIRLAVDGLFMAELLDLAPPDAAMRTRVVATLLDLTRGAAGAEPS